MDRTDLHKTKRPRFYIVDGNGYIYRAFFALPGMNNRQGLPTNAIYGFTNMIRKLLNEEKPDYVAVAFDAKERTFRHDSYEAYKIDRPHMPDDLQQQIPYIRRICVALGLPALEVPGYEADDLIATMMERCKEKDMTGVIVTSDKDLLQLVNDRSRIFTLDPMKDYLVYDEKAVEEKWGVKPDQIVEILSIMGDSIDNVPGVKGIGPKGALELVQKFETVENMLANVDQIEKKAQRQKIEEGKDALLLSKQLVLLRKDVPMESRIEDLKAAQPDTLAARELFLELGFYSILNEFLTTSADRNSEYIIVDSAERLDVMISELSAASLISLHLETDGGFRSPLVGIAFSTKTRSGWYVPLGHRGLSLETQLETESVLLRLKPLLESEIPAKASDNLKQQILVLRNRGISLRGGKYDAMVMSYVLNPTRHDHSLGALAKEYLQYQTRDLKSLVGSGQKEISPSGVPAASFCAYCCEIVDLSREITGMLQEDLKKEEVESVYTSIELPLIPVLAEVEWNGVRIDTNTLDRLNQEMTKNIDRLVSEIYSLAGGEFNINSPRQIGEILFEKLKLPMIKRTRKTKDFSTSQEVLEELAQNYELPQKILEYRQFTKLKSTYIDALPLMIDPKSGRIHTNYQQTVAATGRLSSVDPNLQNIPIRTSWGRLIRDAFVAEKGNWLISADYSQIELRVMAHLSGDEKLIESFLNNEDIHARTASEVFDVPMEMMTKEIRNQAKAINYGINYGQSPFGLSQLLGIDQRAAKEYIERYFQKYTGVKAYLDGTVEFVKANGYVATMFGRRRYLPEIRSKDRTVFQAAQRAAVNTPLQGTAADIIKLAMIEVQREIEKSKFRSQMIMQVHDELVFEVREDEKESVAAMVKEKMENVCKLVVPLTVDLSIGRNWREAK